jgi:hypothetical protein
LPFYGQAALDYGQTTAKLFADTVISGDWVVARMKESIAQLLLDTSAQNRKIPYTDAGIAVLAGVVRRWLKRGESVGHFRPDSSFVTVPLLSTIDSATIAARTLTIQAETTLAGAIDQAVTISLVVNAA